MTPQNVTIKLTPDQFAQLRELITYSWQQCNDENRRGIVYAQLDPKAASDDVEGWLIFGFWDHDIARQVVKIASPEQYERCVKLGWIKDDEATQ